MPSPGHAPGAGSRAEYLNRALRSGSTCMFLEIVQKRVSLIVSDGAWWPTGRVAAEFLTQNMSSGRSENAHGHLE